MAGRWGGARLYGLAPAARHAPNLWDAGALALLLATFVGVAHGGRAALEPLSQLYFTPISLDPAQLPEYALRTTLRMFAAIAASLIFTLTAATLAAKNRRAGAVILPALDMLQSVPVLSFLAFTTLFFLSLFPGQVAGVELASIFAIFTAQAWNMAFSFHGSLTTLPKDLVEASASFRLTGWQRFWRLEAPYAAPGLVWNTMLSMSGSWFFLVVSEAIAVGDTRYALPGIGSYLALALEERDIGAVGWAVGAMFVVILAYDQLLFRPVVAWAERFRFETTASGEPPQSWVRDMVGRARALRLVLEPLGAALRAVARWPLFPVRAAGAVATTATASRARAADAAWSALMLAAVAVGVWRVAAFVEPLGAREVVRAAGLGLLTLTRVVVLIALASLVWVPAGVWIGLRPRWAAFVQPVAQFLAAFPANLLFPVFVIAILRTGADPDVWLSPLMILGTQWYILFNVIAGASAFPGDLKEASAGLRVRGWLWWRRVMLPGVFPHYLTGAMSASGGAWNASIVAEVVTWGGDRVAARGLGAYIADATAAGDLPRVVLGTAIMSAFVIVLNRLVWRRLHAVARRMLGAS